MNEEKANEQSYGQLNKAISIIMHKMEVIEARHTKAIWTDPIYDKEKLRKAELTLRLSEDTEFTSLQEQLWELDAQRRDTPILMDGIDDFRL